jgi:uncharacterized protein YjbJ (UPF0337 family)
MNKNVFVGKWKQVRGQIKVSYAKFTHHNWDQAAGKYDQFVGLVQEKYGVIRAGARKAVNQQARSQRKDKLPIRRMLA